jgi:hypothetical protein
MSCLRSCARAPTSSLGSRSARPPTSLCRDRTHMGRIQSFSERLEVYRRYIEVCRGICRGSRNRVLLSLPAHVQSLPCSAPERRSELGFDRSPSPRWPPAPRRAPTPPFVPPAPFIARLWEMLARAASCSEAGHSDPDAGRKPPVRSRPRGGPTGVLCVGEAALLHWCKHGPASGTRAHREHQ